MKTTIPIALQAHYDSGALSTAYLLKITRKIDGAVYAFTSAYEDVKSEELGEAAGVTYVASQGLLVSGIVTSSGMAVDNTELTTFDDGTLFTRPDVFGGLWSLSEFTLTRYNWADPSNGQERILTGLLGEIRYGLDTLTIELRGLQQYLQQPIGSVSSKDCTATLGDAKCKKDLAALTFSATVTSVTDNQTFTSTDLTQADDYFGNGLVIWTSGNNNKLIEKVKIHSTGGNIILSLPMFQSIQNGDTFDIIAGCRGRFIEDCHTKHNNKDNFQGQPHLPGLDSLTKAVK